MLRWRRGHAEFLEVNGYAEFLLCSVDMKRPKVALGGKKASPKDALMPRASAGCSTLQRSALRAADGEKKSSIRHPKAKVSWGTVTEFFVEVRTARGVNLCRSSAHVEGMWGRGARRPWGRRVARARVLPVELATAPSAANAPCRAPWTAI